MYVAALALGLGDLLEVGHSLFHLLISFLLRSVFEWFFLFKEYVSDVSAIEAKIQSEGPVPLSYLLQHFQAVSSYISESAWS